MRVKFLDLKPNENLHAELDEAYRRVMSSGQYIGGLEVEAFEREWAEYCQAKYCVSCSSGQAALELLLRAFGIGHDDEVIVPSWTAVPTWKAVLNIGAKIKPVEVNEYNLVMWPAEVREAVTENVKAIIPVHLYGEQAFWRYAMPVINDACQAHGLKGLDNAAFSFYPTKNLGAYGDAGAVVTNDLAIADFCREHRDSSRLDPLQAAFLRVKLKYLDTYNGIRAENAALYDSLLTDKVIKPPGQDVYHQYVIRSDRRDELKAALAERGIETMIHYPVPPHRQLGLDFDLPIADKLSQIVLSLPIMTARKNIFVVVEAINELA